MGEWDHFFRIVSMFSGLSALATLVMLVVRPIRDRIFGERERREGEKCLLRSDMLRTYYRHHNENRIRQYEYENFLLEYKAYKARNGNTFIDHIYDEIKTWEVVT